MLPTRIKSIMKKRPFTAKIVFICFIFYTMHSVKVDIGNYVGETSIGITVDDFHYDFSLCNPDVIKTLLLKINSKHDRSTETKKLLEKVHSLLPLGNTNQQISRTFHFPGYFEKLPEIITSSKHVHNLSETTQKSLADFTKLLQNEHGVFDKYKVERNVSVSHRDVISRTRSQDVRGRSGGLSPYHREIREHERLNTQRKLILNAQALTTGTNGLGSGKKKIEISADEDVIQEKILNKTLYSSTHKVITNRTTGGVSSTHKEIITKTAAAVAAAAATQGLVIGNRRDKKDVQTIKRERRRNSISHVVNVAPMSDHKSSPYYVSSIHPLHIDLVKFVREKIERGVKIPVDPVNVQKTDFIYKPTKCQFESFLKFSLLVVVRSNVRHLDMRSMIRDTWGSLKYPNVKMIFAVGSELQAVTDIYEESKLYGDILQGNFTDNPSNMTHKTTMAFKWFNDSCQCADVILLVEEDHLVQIKHIIEYIKTSNRSEIKNLFVGFLIDHAEVERERTSRWSVRWTDFPHKVWPPYLRRGCMLISKEVARQLTEAFPYVQYIHIYDAYLGIVAKKLSLVLQNDVRFFQTGNNLLQTKDHFAFDGFNTPKLLNEAWNTLMHRQN